jgi:hypothetical protein
MPRYNWSCLACGSTNEAVAAFCTVCHCPSQPTMRDVERFRASHLTTGGSISPAAGLLRDSSDNLGMTLLLGIAGMFFAFVPYGWPVFKSLTEKPKENDRVSETQPRA